MIIEEFKNAPAVYDRFLQMGRMLPDGVRYINSWPTRDLKKCFQLMECEDLKPIQQWIDKWSDLTSFEVLEVITSRQARILATNGDFEEA